MSTASLIFDKNPRNGQIYIYDGDIALKLRSACGTTDPYILKTIKKLPQSSKSIRSVIQNLA